MYSTGRALLVAMKKQRDEQKQAEEAAGEEETRALKLLRELEKELSVRQDGEEASPADLEALEIDCYDSVSSVQQMLYSEEGAVAQWYSVGLRSERSRVRTPRPPSSVLEQDSLSSPKYW